MATENYEVFNRKKESVKQGPYSLADAAKLAEDLNRFVLRNTGNEGSFSVRPMK